MRDLAFLFLPGSRSLTWHLPRGLVPFSCGSGCRAGRPKGGAAAASLEIRGGATLPALADVESVLTTIFLARMSEIRKYAGLGLFVSPWVKILNLAPASWSGAIFLWLRMPSRAAERRGSGR